MKAINRILQFGISLLLCQQADGAPFRNLDFEAFDPNTGILSDWQLSFFSPILSTDENSLTLGIPDWALSTLGPTPAYMSDVSRFPSQGIDGKYALTLPSTVWTLRQRGEVPEDSKYLRWVSLGTISMELRIDDQLIPVDSFHDLATAAPVTFRSYSQADISMFAGQEVELEMTSGQTWFSAPGYPNYAIIDNMFFSLVPIPEPPTYALGVVGVLLVGIIKWKRQTLRRTEDG